MLLDADFEVPQCPVCQEFYESSNKSKKAPIVLDCGHGVCRECFKILMGACYSFECPTCRHSLDEDKSHPVNYQLMEALSTFETMKLERGKMQVQCADCAKEDYENKMYTCLHCTIKNHSNFKMNQEEIEKLKKREDPVLIDDVKSTAICANCCIEKHLMRKHEVKPFFPFLSTQQFKEHSSNLDILKKDYHEATEKWENGVQTSYELLTDGMKEFDKMIDMVRRGKSSVIQQSIVGKTEESVKKFVTIVSEMEKTLSEYNSKFKVMLSEVGAENDKRNEKDCLEEVQNLYLIDFEQAKRFYAENVKVGKEKMLKDAKVMDMMKRKEKCSWVQFKKEDGEKSKPKGLKNHLMSGINSIIQQP